MSLTQVNSAGIADGSIVNADLHSSSDIALSKLNTSGTASSSTFLRGDGAWTAIDLSNLSASNLTSGTVPDARFPATLPALSGTALTNLNASNISSGTLAAARVATLNQNTTGSAALATSVTVTANNGNNENVYLAFVDSSAGGTQGIETDGSLSYNPSTNALTTTEFIGGLTGNASGSSGSCTGNAATATALATARTIAGVSFNGSANISLNNNAITNGAGYITSADGGNAATLDSIDSSQFARKDQANTFNTSTEQKIVLAGSNDPYIRFQEGTTNKAYIQWHSSGYLYFVNDEASRQLRMGGTSAPDYHDGSNWYSLWHAGNDGAGSGLDADLWDGNQFSSYLNQAVLTSSNVTHNKIITNEWFRNANSAEGLYNQANDAHFYNANDHYWHINGNSGGTTGGGLILYDQYNSSAGNSTGRKGYLYFSSSGFGLLDSNGSWFIRSDGTNTHLERGSLNITGEVNASNNILCSNWYYNNTSGEGLYNSATTQHFYSDNDDYWNVAGGTGSNGILFRDEHNGTLRGYVYANNNNSIGFLNSGGAWALECSGSSNNFSYNNFLPSANNSKNLGSSSLRWANIYTYDLNLSNEGGSNDVDGTWGNFTIQEGSDDLFLINKRNGKKYKFNLTEVN